MVCRCRTSPAPVCSAKVPAVCMAASVARLGIDVPESAIKCADKGKDMPYFQLHRRAKDDCGAGK